VEISFYVPPPTPPFARYLLDLGPPLLHSSFFFPCLHAFFLTTAGGDYSPPPWFFFLWGFFWWFVVSPSTPFFFAQFILLNLSFFSVDPLPPDKEPLPFPRDIRRWVRKIQRCFGVSLASTPFFSLLVDVDSFLFWCVGFPPLAS